MRNIQTTMACTTFLLHNNHNAKPQQHFGFQLVTLNFLVPILSSLTSDKLVTPSLTSVSLPPVNQVNKQMNYKKILLLPKCSIVNSLRY